MTNERLIEQRRHRRYRVKEGAFAVIRKQADTQTLGQIIDISGGGLAFKYFANGKPSNGRHKLDIFFAGFGIQLKNLSFQTVSDLPIDNQISFSSIKMRRCGLQFKDLKSKHRLQIEDFIQSYTLQ